MVKNKTNFVKNIFSVLFARKSWVGYAPVSQTHVETQNFASLPAPVIRNGVLSPIDALKIKTLNDATIRRLNFLYAKDYTVDKRIRKLGNLRMSSQVQSIVFLPQMKTIFHNFAVRKNNNNEICYPNFAIQHT